MTAVSSPVPVGSSAPRPAPSLWSSAGRVVEYCAITYRRTWRGSIFSSVLNPVLFLLAMGLGLGHLVDHSGRHQAAVSLGHLTYLQFLAPGLLAATAMQVAAFECTYPVLAAIKWVRTYYAMLASPVSVHGIVLGRTLWVAIRLLMTSAIFVAVMAAFGACHSAAVLWAIPVSMLTGLAFATPITAFAATRENDSAFAGLFRFGILPMFLFSGTFFPISQLPSGLRPIAYAIPLWHGVTLCRQVSFGHPALVGTLVHVGYLSAWVAVGHVLAVASHRKRLVV